MLRIGYVRLHDAGAHEDSAALKAAGCQVVRADEPGSQGQALASILGFVGPGDRLVVARLQRLAPSARRILEAIDKLHERGAGLEVLHPPLSSQGSGGATLRAILEAVAEVETPNPASTGRRRAPAPVDEISALQQAGLGPVEIARRLGVSRMTVWRKLKALEAGPGRCAAE